MPQQINLQTAVLSTQRRPFSALFMLQALGALTLVGAAFCLYEVTSLHRQNEATSQALRTGTQVLEGVRLTVRQRQSAAMPAELALQQQLKVRRGELSQLEDTLDALHEGVFRPGEGHASRLALVARSIPPSAWVTLVKADAERLEVSGFTFNPAALNEWIDQLAASPLLAGQQLAAINVAKVVDAPGAPADALHPVWSFSMVKSLDPPSSAAGESR